MAKAILSNKIINIHEAKTHLSKIIEEIVNNNKSFLIGKSGKPQAQIIPIKEEKNQVVYGLLKGKIRISDDFDDENEEINNLFYGTHK
ncbi:MAG: type II toxin-antitoxin system Phd/YefM family antitoxin [Silvanigrellaceae bacterium]|jgi:antitoxin (DNA-binding transcriptional repressor) of toxin-antitoxin stability system|nr:type II toxin-antitoxin system Phd/YefM family antitoxin [Silvanigrellaceae bacterium]